MAYEDELRQIALRLKSTDGYWGTFARIEALMGWLHHRGQCVYCPEQLVDATHMIGGLATTDHLLPKRKYPELDFTDRHLVFRDYLNAVPACDGCNCLKRSWDPNTDGGQQLYYSGKDTRLNYDMQHELIERAKKYIAGERERRHITNEKDRINWSVALHKIERL